MKIAYLDCLSGISGDMVLGALVDAGVPLEAVQQGIASLGLPDCQLVREEVKRKGFRATKINVQHPPEHAHRHLHHIHEMIDRSTITDEQKDLARRIFYQLAKAEAKVHGSTIEKVHFHEVGAVDSIADIVGAAIAWDLLKVDRIECSPVPVGSGTIKIAHGIVNVPAPATAELLMGIPLGTSVVESELTTPTGAAIVATIVDRFGTLPPMSLSAIGYGAGDRDFSEQANILRLLVGELPDVDHSVVDQVWMLETQLDDCTGEMIAYTTEKLHAHGALDVYTTAIQMKKNRPGVLISVLCYQEHVEKLERILFRETGTLGVRRWAASRHKLTREPHTVETSLGPVAGKLARLADGTSSFAPEYESCRAVAEASGRPLPEVYQAAQTAFRNR